MDEELLKSLPGAEIVLPGIEDLRHGRDSVNADAVRGARARLARAGLPVPDGPATPGGRDELPAAHRLYEQLARDLGDGAHARYNAILARVDSFARAAELARAR